MGIQGQGYFLTLAKGYMIFLHMKIKACVSQKSLGHFYLNFVCNHLGTYSLYKKKRKHYIIFNNLRTFKEEHFKLTGDLDWHVPYQ